MGALSQWAVRSPLKAIAAWILLAVTIGATATQIGGTYNNSFSLPDTESTRAQELLSEIPGAGDSFNAATAKIVWKSENAPAADPAVAQAATAMLAEISEIPSVGCVVHPYGAPIGRACPEQTGNPSVGFDPSQIPAEQLKVLAGLGAAGFSTDASVAFATVTFDVEGIDVPIEDSKAVVDAVAAAQGEAGLVVGANGQVLEFAGQEPPSSEAIGVTVALVILLFTFGSIVGAFLPIISALVSLGVGQALILIVANYLDVATFAPTIAAMIGLAVGIDYALFVLNRYKEDLDAGQEPKLAASEAARTAGRAVFFAAITVIIALLGLFVMRIDFFNGLAVASAATVIMMMIGATILLPAILSLMGRKVFALRMPWARKVKEYDPDARRFARYGLWLENHYKPVGALALVVLLAIASPVLSLRLGFADDSGKAEGNVARTAYDLVAEGFGPGLNGPFVIAIQTATDGDNAAVQAFTQAVQADEGVAAAIGLPVAPDSNLTALQVIPNSAPQDAETTDLLNRLRDTVIPEATANGALEAYVGGTQAITTDFTSVLVDALPLFLAVVVGMGFLTLVVLFRSILVPLVGAITSLLSLSAAMGVTVAVFQWGWLGDQVGITGTGPIFPFLPIMVFAILFGLGLA